MKIAFWSNVHGQTGITSNMLAISVLCALQYKRKTMVTQTHFNLNNLDAALVSVPRRMKREFFMDIGIDALTRNIKSSPLDQEIIENCSLSFLNKQLNLLPGTSKPSREVYENDINKSITGILRATSLYYDIVFIDTNSGNSELTMKILEDVDLIVVNLSQNKSILDDFALNYTLKDKKIFYLLGKYDCNSRYTIKNIRKIYKWMKVKNTAVIPYNTEFMDAISDGQVIEFILKNLTSDKDDSNGYFIKEIRSAAGKMLKYISTERR